MNLIHNDFMEELCNCINFLFFFLSFLQIEDKWKNKKVKIKFISIGFYDKFVHVSL